VGSLRKYRPISRRQKVAGFGEYKMGIIVGEYSVALQWFRHGDLLQYKGGLALFTEPARCNVRPRLGRVA